MKRKKNKINRQGENLLYIIVGTILLLSGIGSVRFFTGNWIGYHHSKNIKFEEHVIPNVISGLTAPFFGLLGTLVLIATFRRQTDANLTLQEEINKENYFKSFDEIIRSIDSTKKYFSDIDIKPYEIEEIVRSVYPGSEGHCLSDDIIKTINKEKSNSTKFDEIYTFIRLFEETTKCIEMFHDPEDDFNFCTSESRFNFKRVLRLKASTLYHSEVKPIIAAILKIQIENTEFRNLYKSAEALFNRFSWNNSKFWGCQTQVLILDIPICKNKNTNLYFWINGASKNESKEKRTEILISIVAQTYNGFKKVLFIISTVFLYRVRPHYVYYKMHVGNYVSNIELGYAFIQLKNKNSRPKMLSDAAFKCDLQVGCNYLNAKIIYPRQKKINCLVNIIRTKEEKID